MPTVSQKQHNFMKRVLKDKKFAKDNKITPQVAREFLEADVAQAECIIHYNVKAWTEDKTDTLWVTGKPQSDFHSLAKKLATTWDATLVDVDKLVKEAIDENGSSVSQKDIIKHVFDGIKGTKGRVVAHGVQVIALGVGNDSWVALDPTQVLVKRRQTLLVRGKANSSYALLKKKKTTPTKGFEQMIQQGRTQASQVVELLQYDPNKDLGEE